MCVCEKERERKMGKKEGVRSRRKKLTERTFRGVFWFVENGDEVKTHLQRVKSMNRIRCLLYSTFDIIYDASRELELSPLLCRFYIYICIVRP